VIVMFVFSGNPES